MTNSTFQQKQWQRRTIINHTSKKANHGEEGSVKSCFSTNFCKSYVFWVVVLFNFLNFEWQSKKTNHGGRGECSREIFCNIKKIELMHIK